MINESLTYAVVYMFIYNITLMSALITVFNYVLTKSQTMYSLSNLEFSKLCSTSMVVLILSLAGVPPFIGFFSKILILLSVVSNGFVYVMPFLIVVLFAGLYFYIQNIRFLFTNSKRSGLPSTHVFGKINDVNSVYLNSLAIYIIINGFAYMDDIIAIFN